VNACTPEGGGGLINNLTEFYLLSANIFDIFFAGQPAGEVYLTPYFLFLLSKLSCWLVKITGGSSPPQGSGLESASQNNDLAQGHQPQQRCASGPRWRGMKHALDPQECAAKPAKKINRDKSIGPKPNH